MLRIGDLYHIGLQPANGMIAEGLFFFLVLVIIGLSVNCGRGLIILIFTGVFLTGEERHADILYISFGDYIPEPDRLRKQPVFPVSKIGSQLAPKQYRCMDIGHPTGAEYFAFLQVTLIHGNVDKAVFVPHICDAVEPGLPLCQNADLRPAFTVIIRIHGQKVTTDGMAAQKPDATSIQKQAGVMEQRTAGFLPGLALIIGNEQLSVFVGYIQTHNIPAAMQYQNAGRIEKITLRMIRTVRYDIIIGKGLHSVVLLSENLCFQSFYSGVDPAIQFHPLFQGQIEDLAGLAYGENAGNATFVILIHMLFCGFAINGAVFFVGCDHGCQDFRG